MKGSFEIKIHFPVKPAVLYQAWLDSSTHSKMTGGEAVCSPEIGGAFSAWDGYISGKTISLTAGEEIVQKWRTTEFDKEDEDSELILRFKAERDGCKLTLRHSNIPEGQPDYKQGWKDYYFDPMKSYFDNQ